MGYDAAGNRQHIVTDIAAEGASQHVDGWYVYDAMHRQIVVNALDAQGTLGTQGRRIAYDFNGNRISDTWHGPALGSAAAASRDTELSALAIGLIGQAGNANTTASGETTATYAYDAQNRMIASWRDGQLVQQRQYDAAGRLAIETGGTVDEDTVKQLNSALPEADRLPERRSIYSYDANGRMTYLQVLHLDGGRDYDMDYRHAYDAVGNVLRYQVHGYSDDGYTNTFTNTYAQYEGDVITDTHGSSTVNDNGASHRRYDVNGDLIAITDDAEGANNRSYGNDAFGRALAIRQNGRTLRQLIVNGEVLGRYGNGVNPYDARDDDNHPQFATITDLNFSYQIVNATHPGSAPGSYLVAAGDTLQSIARRQYGDAGYWYQIALANGLDNDSALVVGRKLDIPSITGTTFNRADSFRPYDASTVIGDTTPTLPPPDDGCGILGAILIIVIVVVATIFTAGAMTAAAGTSLTGIFSAGASALASGGFAVGFIAGAVGSAVGQVVAVATGIQKDFNWNAVALGALSGGVASEIGAAAGVGAQGANATWLGGSTLAPTVARSMLGNAITQGVAVATGLQDKFSWANVAAAGIGSAVGYLAGDALGMRTQGFATAGFAERLAKSTLSGLAAGAAAAIARGGRVTVQQVAMDAFGNALGNSIAEYDWSGAAQDSMTARERFRRAEIEAMNAEAQSASSPYSLAYGMSDSIGLRPGGGVGLRISDSAYAEFADRVDSGVTQAAARLSPDDLRTSFDLDTARDKWIQTGQKPVYDFGDPFAVGDVDDSLAAGPTRPVNRPFQMARNPTREAAGQLISDPWGLIGPGWAGEYNGLSDSARRYAIKQELDEIRTRLGASGRRVPDIPKAWVSGGQLVDDFSPAQLERFRTMDNLEMLRRQGIVELDANWGIKSVASGREMFINPNQVRFTQEWVSYTSSDKVNTLDTTGRTARTTPEKLPAMDVVVMPDGRLTSLDNRRLTAAQLYDAENVRVIIHAADDMLPNQQTMERFSWKTFNATSWGDAAVIRIFKQGPEFRESFRQGSPAIPQVKYAPDDPLYKPYIMAPTCRR